MIIRGLAAGLLALCLSACGTLPLGSAQPSFENVQALQSGQAGVISVGEFSASPSLAAARNRSVPARGYDVTPPQGASFSDYLKERLKAELAAAGRYDAKAPTTISGVLTLNELDASGTSVGTARLGARFKLVREAHALYDKEIDVDDRWESSFVGATAIPGAVNHYTALYKALLGKLFADEEFRSAAGFVAGK